MALRQPQRVPLVENAQLLAIRVAELDALIGAGRASDTTRRERDDLRTQLAAALAREKPPA